MHGVMAYAEDPCGAEDGFSGREVMARVPTRHRPANSHQYGGHRLAGNDPQHRFASRLIFRWPTTHFWTLQGSVRVAQLCKMHDLTWGSHSNNHFDVSLAMFTHCAARRTRQGHSH